MGVLFTPRRPAARTAREIGRSCDRRVACSARWLATTHDVVLESEASDLEALVQCRSVGWNIHHLPVEVEARGSTRAALAGGVGRAWGQFASARARTGAPRARAARRALFAYRHG